MIKENARWPLIHISTLLILAPVILVRADRLWDIRVPSITARVIRAKLIMGVDPWVCGEKFPIHSVFIWRLNLAGFG